MWLSTVCACREKTQLQEDIKQKQELIQQRKGEIEVRCVCLCVWGVCWVVGTNCMKTLPPTSPSQSLQSEVEVGTKQREELEREKLDVQGKLDLLDSEVYILAGYMVETSLLEFVVCLVAESQV